MATAAPSFRVNNFDLLRIFAATQVLIFHTIDRLGIEGLFWLDPLRLIPGVPIFFVISGYLVSKSFEKSGGLRTYAEKRIRRIFPGLWMCIAITTLAASALGFGFFNLQGLAWFSAQLAGMIYTPAFLDTFGSGTYNGALWTIPVELQFYLLVPLLYWPLRRTGRPLLLVGALVLLFGAIAIGMRHAYPELYSDNAPAVQKLLRYSFLPHVYLFFFGVLLQKAEVFRSGLIAGKGLFWLAAYAVFRAATPDTPGFEIAAMLLLGVTAVSIAYTKPRLSERVLGGIDISYGIYIYHGLILNILVELGFRGGAELLPAVAALTFLAGYASWMLVERPILHRSRPKTVALAG